MTAGRRATARALATLALAVVPLGAATVTVTAAPVHAAAAPDGAVELSVDGSTWAQDVTTPLFDPAFRWVPGDVETGTLYVRTRACAAATGEATVTVGPEETELARDLDTRTRVDGGAWSAGTSTPSFTVGRGDVVRIDVEVAFDPESGNPSQSRTVPLDVTVTLACDDRAPSPTPTAPSPGVPAPGPGAEPPPGGGAAPPAAGPDGLPRTGVEIARTLTAAALLVTAGLWLAAASRRRGPANE